MRFCARFDWARALRSETQRIHRRWSIGVGHAEEQLGYQDDLEAFASPWLSQVVQSVTDTRVSAATGRLTPILLLTNWRFAPLRPSLVMRLAKTSLEMREGGLGAFVYLSEHAVLLDERGVDMLVWSASHAGEPAAHVIPFLDHLGERYLRSKTEERASSLRPPRRARAGVGEITGERDSNKGKSGRAAACLARAPSAP